MIQPTKTNLEDVAALIGFGATLRLIEWYGGSSVYVPDQPSEDHVLARLMGYPALRALSSEFGCQTIWIPEAPIRAQIETKRDVARRIIRGEGSTAISTALGISVRQVQRIRRELEDVGILPRILGGSQYKDTDDDTDD